MTYFQDSSQLIAKTPLVPSEPELAVRGQITQSIFAIAQVVTGVLLLALSTHLALESEAYLEVLNRSGLNQYHAFALLVCISFFAGILLIAQQVLHYGSDNFDQASNY